LTNDFCTHHRTHHVLPELEQAPKPNIGRAISSLDDFHFEAQPPALKFFVLLLDLCQGDVPFEYPSD